MTAPKPFPSAGATFGFLADVVRKYPWLMGTLVLAVVICVWWGALQRQPTLADLKLVQAHFDARYAANPLAVTAVYFTAFTLLTALCLPGASVLLLLAGASLGLAWGTVVALVASTAGATLTLLASRYFFQSQIVARFPDRLRLIDAGLQREGALYLLSLRLLPVIPFAAVNLLCGVVHIPVGVFVRTSFLGMLPGTIAYVNAGQQLSRVNSLASLGSTELLVALTVLGLLPLVMLWGIALWRRSKK